ncbi:MAG: ISAs1 family transposase [Cyanobacteria bacterium P01_F01_bin.86]
MQLILKKTLQLILESENDYVVTVKGNQARLHRQVESIVTHCKALQAPLIIQEQHRGRLETRHVSVFSAADIDTEQWPEVKTIVCVDRHRQSQGKCTQHRAYYISSVSAASQAWMRIIRGHWSVENRLHWCKDVVLNEDKTYGREPNSLLNASVFRSIAINVLRLNGFESLKPALRELANQIPQIFKLLQ